MHLGQGSGKEHAIEEEHILHVVLQAQIFLKLRLTKNN